MICSGRGQCVRKHHFWSSERFLSSESLAKGGWVRGDLHHDTYFIKFEVINFNHKHCRAVVSLSNRSLTLLYEGTKLRRCSWGFELAPCILLPRFGKRLAAHSQTLASFLVSHNGSLHFSSKRLIHNPHPFMDASYRKSPRATQASSLSEFLLRGNNLMKTRMPAQVVSEISMLSTGSSHWQDWKIQSV